MNQEQIKEISEIISAYITCGEDDTIPKDYKPGDLVLYVKYLDQERHYAQVEIGVVKAVTENGCRVGYHLGDTCAMTPFHMIYPIHNEYAIKGLLDRSTQLGRRWDDLSEGCEVWDEARH